MKRLIKSNNKIFENTLEQLSDQGRKILKDIEDYKFKLEQTVKIVSNDESLSNKIIQKQKQLDVASGQIYSIVFDIDNMDIINNFQQLEDES